MLSALERPSAKNPMKGPVTSSARCAPQFLTNNRTLCSQKMFTNPNYVNEFPSNMRPVDNSLHNYSNSCPKPTIGPENTPQLTTPPSGKTRVPQPEKEGEMGRGNKPIDPLSGTKKCTTINGQQSKAKEGPEIVQLSDAMDHKLSPCLPEVSNFHSNEDLAFDWGNSPRNRSLSLTASEDSFVIFDNEGNEEFTSEDESSDEEPACSRRRLSVTESEDSFIMFDRADVESMEDLSEEDEDEDQESADISESFDEVDFCRVARKKVRNTP